MGVLTTNDLDAALRDARDNYPNIMDKLTAIGNLCAACLLSDSDRTTVNAAMATEVIRRQALSADQQNGPF